MINDIKKALWASADKLRAKMDAAQYKHLVLGLIFLKYISDIARGHMLMESPRYASCARLRP